MPAKATIPDCLRPLAEFSSLVGADPEQVQAAGGNTSLKRDGVMWVKASGLWLKDACECDLFVPVSLAKLQAGYHANEADPVAGSVIGELNPQGLRPSIETSLHAMLPQRYVAHTHSVRTLAIAIRQDWRAILHERLSGLNWCSVPYNKPGLDLTRAMLAAMPKKPADVIILGNHGLVVAADELDDLVALLAEVEQRLHAPVIDLVTNGTKSSPPPGWRPVVHPAADNLVYNHQLRHLATCGSLYPDHVIFLGSAAAVDEPAIDSSKLWLNRTAGALLPAGSGPSCDEMALCLALVLARVPPDAEMNYLTRDHEAALLNWDAEKYRQALAKQN